jgi:hypothetical protein
MGANWRLWDNSTSTWNDYTNTGDFNTYPGGSYTYTLTQSMLPPADASGYMILSVQVSGWDANCTWDNHGIIFTGCENYSPWTQFALSASCSQSLIRAGHYVIKRRGHYVYYVRRHHRYRRWIKPVRAWVPPVYSAQTCQWVNA